MADSWSPIRRLESWPAPSLSRLREELHGARTSTLVARQPILGKDLDVRAYALLVGGADAPDAEAETARTLLAALADIGLDELVGVKRAFVPVTRPLLLGQDAAALPADRLALVVGPEAGADDVAAAAMRRLRAAGHSIVLGGFAAGGPRDALLPLCDVVAIDVRVAGGTRELVRAAADPRLREVEILATGIEDHEAADACRLAGFELLQGPFFARPRIVVGRAVPASRLSRLRLVAALQDPAAEIEDLEAVVAADVGLSFRLLRLINSAAFPISREIHSVREAIVLLGMSGVRTLATLVTLAGMDDKPLELGRTALTRARMCEGIARALGRREPAAHFTVGLLSVLDAFMDARMEDVVASLPLADDVTAALVGRAGVLGRGAHVGSRLRARRLQLAARRARRRARRRLPRRRRVGRRGGRAAALSTRAGAPRGPTTPGRGGPATRRPRGQDG